METREWKVESNTEKGKFYTVRHSHYGWECECTFVLYHPSRKCRHIAHVLGICRKPGCKNKNKARQLCSQHYSEWYRSTHKRKIKSYKKGGRGGSTINKLPNKN